MCIAYLLMHLYSWLYSYAQQHHLLYSLDFNLHALVSSITIIIILILRKVFLVISWNAFSSGHLVSLKLVNFHHWYIDGGGLWLGTKKKHGKCQWSKDTTTSLCMCGLQKMPMQDYYYYVSLAWQTTLNSNSRKPSWFLWRTCAPKKSYFYRPLCVVLHVTCYAIASLCGILYGEITLNFDVYPCNQCITEYSIGPEDKVPDCNNYYYRHTSL